MFAAQYIPYRQTKAFSSIVLDYLEPHSPLSVFYHLPPEVSSFRSIIEEKKHQVIDRETLVAVLKEQYSKVLHSEVVIENIEALSSPNTFTVCTAHQPNLFTGPLYFIYKIIHAIRLSDFLKAEFPEYHFVPVYYMGSEDADLAELNHTYIEGKKLEWKTTQTGAVGRMKVDKELLKLVTEMEGQLSVLPFGKEVVSLIRKCYSEGKQIQDATFELVNELFGAYGLVVLVPDHILLKRQMTSVFFDDLFQHIPAGIVQKTSEKLSTAYDAQAYPREINLFYLHDGIRDRIEKKGDGFEVVGHAIGFTETELKEKLSKYPDRFSPNVVLRGLYQETILPNIAFIGGGGELAYWMQLKDLFAHYKIVYPILVLRNSYLVLEKKWQNQIKHLGLEYPQIFQPATDIVNQLVKRSAKHPISLNGHLGEAEQLYEAIRMQAMAIDPSLSKHVAALQACSIKTLTELEKKMLRAEKRKHNDTVNQVARIRNILFPKDGLQERVENFSLFYAKWGISFIEALYENALALEQEFCILQEQ